MQYFITFAEEKKQREHNLKTHETSTHAYHPSGRGFRKEGAQLSHCVHSLGERLPLSSYTLPNM